MSQLDPRLLSHFDFSNFQSASGPIASRAGTLAEQNGLIDSLNLIYQDAAFYDLFLPSGLIADSTGATDRIVVRMTTVDNNAFYISPGLSFSGSPPPVTDSYIAFGKDIFAGIQYKANDASIQSDPLSLIALHEIVHSSLSPNTFGGDYREEGTIFVSNYFKDRLFGQSPDRVGHASVSDNLVSASSTSYLAGYTMTGRNSATSAQSNLIFEFEATNPEKQITKTYYGEGSSDVDHLVTIEAKTDGWITNVAASVFSESVHTDIVHNSIVEAPTVKLDTISSTKSALSSFIGAMSAISEGGAKLPWLQELSDRLPEFTTKGLLTVSAERFTDIYSEPTGIRSLDVQGPVKAGALDSSAANAPDAIRLAAEGTEGTLIFGASGFTGSKFTNGMSFNLGTSVDRLVGGIGNDILVVGDGIDPNATLRSIASGGDGADILMGSLTNGARTTLIGGYGDPDIFIGGAGEDYMIGSYGSIASYAASLGGVTLDMRSPVAIQYADAAGTVHSASGPQGSGGDAAGDVYVGISTFIGSQSGDNTFFTTAGSGYNYFLGGNGDDTFHLTPKNIAYGGFGADSFYIDTSTASNGWFYIADLDEQDRIYIDGNLYTGRTINIETVPHTMNGHTYYTYQVVEDTSAWNPGRSSDQIFGAYRNDWIYHGIDEFGQYTDSNLNGTAQLRLEDYRTGLNATIFLGGWQDGDAGINMKLDYPVYSSDIGVSSINTGNGFDDYYQRASMVNWNSLMEIPWNDGFF